MQGLCKLEDRRSYQKRADRRIEKFILSISCKPKLYPMLQFYSQARTYLRSTDLGFSASASISNQTRTPLYVGNATRHEMPSIKFPYLGKSSYLVTTSSLRWFYFRFTARWRYGTGRTCARMRRRVRVLGLVPRSQSSRWYRVGDRIYHVYMITSRTYTSARLRECDPFVQTDTNLCPLDNNRVSDLQIFCAKSAEQVKDMAVSWSELVDGIRRAFSTDCVDVNEVKRLMSSYESNRSDWITYEKYDPHR